MNIVVLVKQVPGTNKVEVDPVTGVLKRDGVESEMNPYDLFAIEQAMRIKEEYGGNVQALTMGPPQATAVIEEAIYMGADKGTVISDRRFAGADVLSTTRTISGALKTIGNIDLIVCGKQTTDGDTAQVGPEVAEFLNIPHAANVTEITDIEDGHITVVMNMEQLLQTQRMKLPALITVEKDANTPRLPSLKRSFQYQNNVPVQIRSLDDFEDENPDKYGLSGSPTQVERIFPPEKNIDRAQFEGEPEDLAEKIADILKQKKIV
ncbi:MAG: electron transfer flavoprotein subunit beta/FixA family protein [Oscillospiraceae bacterium]|nr:electron transfer flavoprotein subunit beta/FixA family protein [Oscillospiraceae bacterium]